MINIFKIKIVLVLLICIISNLSFAQNTKQDSLTEVSTVGIFDGKIVREGNFDVAKVYKINEYCISPSDIPQNLADSLRGKNVIVSGKLKIIIGETFPAKESENGTIYEPYKEPDKMFIIEPTFKILDENLQVLVRIKNILPIGWGTIYQCEIIEIRKGVLYDIDVNFVMSISAGSEFINNKIHELIINETYLIEFKKTSVKSETTYIPAGTTGLMDNNGMIWNITSLKKE